MKANELRDLTLQELEEKENEFAESLFNLRIRHSLNQLDNPLEIRNVRRNLARVKSVVTELRKQDKQASEG